MQQYIRIALCMFLFVGYLQANPICSRMPEFDMVDLGFPLLTKDVSCGKGVNFTSPTNVKDDCLIAALKIFMAELNRAKTHCNGTHRITQALESIDMSPICPQPTTSPDCKWENEGSSKQFKDFVGNFKDLMTKIEAASAIGAEKI